MKIKAKNYEKRALLELDARDWDATKDTIEGTEMEMSRLGLSHRSKVFGIKCVVTDITEPARKQHPRPDRGQVKKSGILGK